MIVINELHPVCSHLQRLHIVCIVKARLIREIVKVIIWVGETNDYCYIWVGKWTIIIRSIQDAKNTASLHKYAKNRLSGKFIGGNDLEMQYFAKKELWFERFWRWNFSILMQLLCSFQLHPAFKSVRICQMLPQNLKFKEKGVFYWFKYILNEYFYSPSFFCELVSFNYVRPHIIYKSKHTLASTSLYSPWPFDVAIVTDQQRAKRTNLIFLKEMFSLGSLFLIKNVCIGFRWFHMTVAEY